MRPFDARYMTAERGEAEVTEGALDVVIVQQSVWDSSRLSMPLAAGYLKATAEQDAELREHCSIRIVNVRGGNQVDALLRMLFADHVPDVLAFSVYGWNIATFGGLAETFKQLRRDGLVIFGGTHVANQAANVVARYPAVDIVVNGEGERPFREILKIYRRTRSIANMRSVAGISLNVDGKVETTGPAERVLNLADIPSPILTGAIPLTDEEGRFLYDVALLETNRGCPYHCAFCYWGGAVGQKVRAFPRDRLRAEVEALAAAGAEHLVLCDANFGMLRDDLTFIEDVIRIRERTGLPRSVDTSWAKNKGKIFRAIVETMAAAGLTSSFTLALQTLDDAPLALMNRRNMKINDWRELVSWLRDRQLQCYAELVWGSPGETPKSFLEGYDSLARSVSQIATYPLLALPNTDYVERREEFGIVTVKGAEDDFEYVVATNSFTVAEHLEMQHFLMWARTIGEHRYFRLVFAAARSILGMEQSEVLLSWDAWLHRSATPATEGIRARCGRLITAQDVSVVMLQLHTSPGLRADLHTWWTELIDERCTTENDRMVLRAAFDYDLVTLPIYDGSSVPEDVELINDGHAYRRCGLKFPHDMRGVERSVRDGVFVPPDVLEPWTTDVEYLAGFAPHVDSHEISAKYFGVPVDGSVEA